jgi:hypothetical protein
MAAVPIMAAIDKIPWPPTPAKIMSFFMSSIELLV